VLDLLRLLVMPPLSLLLAAALGLVLRRKRERLGTWVAGVAAGLLVLLCVPLVGAALLRGLQGAPLDPARIPEAQAIVLLTADFAPEAPEYGGAAAGPLTLERARYAARLARETGLPLLVSGGVVASGGPPLADLAAEVCAELGAPPRWRETRSGDTRANARRSAELLRPAGVERVLLVTHAWHVPRARAAFARAGLEAIPAPTGFRAWPPASLGALLPSARGLRESCWAVHEWIGRAWYALSE